MKYLTLIISIAVFYGCSSTGEVQKTTTSKTREVKVEKEKPEVVALPENLPEKKVFIRTTYGDIKVKLYNETPLHRDNFIKLVREGFYDSILFHRVIQNFMIQGGDPDSRGARPGQYLGEGGPGYTIPAEFDSSLFHKRGVIAAAREGDDVNPQRASSGSQFYIVQGRIFSDEQLDKLEEQRLGGRKIPAEHRAVYRSIGGTPHLDGSYTVFGEVIEGMDVVDKIAASPTDKNNRPVNDVIMSIEIIE